MEWDLLLGAEAEGAVMSGAQIVMTTLTLPSTPTITAHPNWCVEPKWLSRYAYLKVFLKMVSLLSKYYFRA